MGEKIESEAGLPVTDKARTYLKQGDNDIKFGELARVRKILGVMVLMFNFSALTS